MGPTIRLSIPSKFQNEFARHIFVRAARSNFGPRPRMSAIGGKASSELIEVH
jgi:hypothetical protein